MRKGGKEGGRTGHGRKVRSVSVVFWVRVFLMLRVRGSWAKGRSDSPSSLVRQKEHLSV